MPDSYWTSRTLSRRNAIRGATAAGGAIAALSLIGCGGGKSSKSAGTGEVNKTTGVTDSTKGKPGGTFIWGASGQVATNTYDPVSSALSYTSVGLSYSGLLGHRWGQDSVGLFDYYDLEPDLAQALPEQPDETTMIFKLRPGVKFHNGRLLTSEDVKYSFDRHVNAETSVFRVKWRTWYDKVETPDAQTVIVKSKLPYADAVTLMAANIDAYVMAKEFEETGKSLGEMMGTGPFILVDSAPGTLARWKKNPDYYLKPYPYFDEVQAIGYFDPIKRVADFVSGQIHLPWLVYADERDQIKQQRPNARLQGWTSWAQSAYMRTDKPPFNDKRVRQALSMTIDRKKIREVATKGEGRDDQWFPLMYKDIFGFKEVKELGAASKYWEYNPSEAKKLFAAAGIDKPIEAPMHHWPAAVVGQFLPDIATATEAQWRELGMANIKDDEQVATQYNITTAQGNYDGMALAITTNFNSGAPAFTLAVKDQWWWGPNGEHAPVNVGYVNNPQLNILVEKQLRQLKLEDRKATYHEMEPILAEEQYRLVYSTTTQNYFFDPALKNAVMTVEQGSRRFMMRWWLDKA